MSLFKKKSRPGDRLRERYDAGEPGMVEFFNVRIDDGLTPEDIQTFYNQVSPSDIDRMVKPGNMFRSVLYKKFLEDGLSEKEATQRALRSLPFYGSPDPSLPPHPSLIGDDRPLPHEYMNRVAAWSTRMGVTGHGKTEYDYEARGFTSVNALIRAEARAGRI